jgi:hypothetical protein
VQILADSLVYKFHRQENPKMVLVNHPAFMECDLLTWSFDALIMKGFDNSFSKYVEPLSSRDIKGGSPS